MRVIDYVLDGVMDSEPIYRLVTSILDPAEAPADELAALYHQRWDIETALDELKTHLRGAKIVLRSKTPDLVRQEFYGLLLVHFAIRGLMHEAAAEAGIDPDELPFMQAVRVIRRRLPRLAAPPPQDLERFHRATLSEVLDERASRSPQSCVSERSQTENERLPSSPANLDWDYPNRCSISP